MEMNLIEFKNWCKGENRQGWVRVTGWLSPSLEFAFKLNTQPHQEDHQPQARGLFRNYLS